MKNKIFIIVTNNFYIWDHPRLEFPPILPAKFIFMEKIYARALNYLNRSFSKYKFFNKNLGFVEPNQLINVKSFDKNKFISPYLAAKQFIDQKIYSYNKIIVLGLREDLILFAEMIDILKNFDKYILKTTEEIKPETIKKIKSYRKKINFFAIKFPLMTTEGFLNRKIVYLFRKEKTIKVKKLEKYLNLPFEIGI